MTNKLEYDTAYATLRQFTPYIDLHGDLEYLLKAYINMFAPIPKDALLSAHKSLKLRQSKDLLLMPLEFRKLYTMLFEQVVTHNPQTGRSMRNQHMLQIRIRNEQS